MDTSRLLIVEDDDPTREMIRQIFEHAICTVISATTLDEGLAALEPPPDFLVMDLNLPHGDGIEVLQQIRRSGLPIRVAVCTGRADCDHLKVVAGPDPGRLHDAQNEIEALYEVLELRSV